MYVYISVSIYTQEPHGLGRDCTHTLTTSSSATVEIVLMNLFPTDIPLGNIEAHVIHLHGHYFRVVHVGWGNCSSNSADAICTHNDIICDDPGGLHIILYLLILLQHYNKIM